MRRAIAVVMVVGDPSPASPLLANAPSLEQEALVARFAVRHEPAPQGIVVVGIDSETLTELGPWPFKRSLHAGRSSASRARALKQIVYDVQFTEETKPREDLALYRRDPTAPAAPCSRRPRSTTRATPTSAAETRTSSEIHARAAAANLDDGERGVVTRFPPASSACRRSPSRRPSG